MRNRLYLLLLLTSASVLAQGKLDKLREETVAEGKRLYASEMASWYGTDLFLEKYKEREKFGGYFSYVENNVPKCVFFSKGGNPKAICTITFDESYDTKTAVTDLLERDFTTLESDLCILRTTTLKAITTDTIFKHFKNTNFNLIPLISNGEKKVYVLTGPAGNNNVVIYGNDYLVTFDKKNRVKKIKRLHANILPVEYGDTDPDKKAVAGMHSHLAATGELITATDICTTMLYEKLTGWDTYYVMSKRYVSLWNCKTDKLFVMTIEAWERIGKDQEKK
jgi:hypothetical protein